MAMIALLALPAQAIQHRSAADLKGNAYTEALNILYANGRHDISDLQHARNVVHAGAVGSSGQRMP